MFKVKRKKLKNLRNGSSGVEQAPKSYNDGGSDSSSAAGGSSNSTNQRKKYSKTNELDLDGNQRSSCGSQSGSNNDNGNSTLSKSVSFSIVYVREFERILGDNPSCSSGAPIAIGWAYGNERKINLDHFEESKSGLRKKQLGLVLTRQAREELLLDWGVSFHDIIDAIRTNVRVKNQRRRTVNAIGTYDRWEEVMENASRKIKKTLFLKKSKKDDQLISQPGKAMKRSSDEYIDNRNQAPSNNQSLTAVRQGNYSVSSDKNSKGSNESSDSHLNREIATDSTDRGSCYRHTGPRFRDSRPLAENDEGQCDRDDAPSFPVSVVETGFAKIPYVEITPNFHESEKKRSTYEKAHHAKPESSLSLLKKVLENPRYLDAMDDPGAFYVYDDISLQTPLSEFSYTEANDEEEEGDDDDEDDGDEEFEALDRDFSHWEVRSSGQNRPVIRKKMTPVVISEDGLFEHDETGWQENYVMQPLAKCDGGWSDNYGLTSPPNSAQIISSWE